MHTENPEKVEEREEEEAYIDIQEAGGREMGGGLYIHSCPFSQPPNNTTKKPRWVQRTLPIMCEHFRLLVNQEEKI